MSTAPRTSAPPLQIVSAALPPELVARLRAMAQREERSVSDVTRRIIRQALTEDTPAPRNG
jgi:plasmid stability protein